MGRACVKSVASCSREKNPPIGDSTEKAGLNERECVKNAFAHHNWFVSRDKAIKSPWRCQVDKQIIGEHAGFFKYLGLLV